MAEVSGKFGSFTFTGITTGTALSWTVNDAMDIYDKTDFVDANAGYKTKIAGLPNWTATIEALWDSSNTADSGDSALLTLVVTTGKTYSGTAMIESISLTTVAAGEPIKATYSFVQNGALTRP